MKQQYLPGLIVFVLNQTLVFNCVSPEINVVLTSWKWTHEFVTSLNDTMWHAVHSPRHVNGDRDLNPVWLPYPLLTAAFGKRRYFSPLQECSIRNNTNTASTETIETNHVYAIFITVYVTVEFAILFVKIILILFYFYFIYVQLNTKLPDEIILRTQC